MQKLVLASRSPQRSEILKQFEIPFRCAPSNCEELTNAANPNTLAVENAKRKALATRAAQDELILASDTVVALQDHHRYQFFGKPKDHAEANAFLHALSGKTHLVVSGFAFAHTGTTINEGYDTTLVTFHPLTENIIEGYLAKNEWQDRAGGYAIQGEGRTLVQAIDGDYLNVVGLPKKAVAVAKSLLGFEGQGDLRKFSAEFPSQLG